MLHNINNKRIPYTIAVHLYSIQSFQKLDAENFLRKTTVAPETKAIPIP